MSDSLSPSAISLIPKLEGESNYQAWAIKLEATAQCGGFWGPFIGDNSPSSTADAAETDRLKMREMKACGLILNTVSSTLQLELKNLKVGGVVANAQQRWQHLKDKFEKATGLLPGLQFNQLVKSYFVDDGTLEQQFNKHIEIRAQCALNGWPLEDWQYAQLLLSSLPTEYRNIGDSLMVATTDYKTLKSADVIKKVVDQANYNKAPAPSSSVASLLTNKAGGSSGPAKSKNKKGKKVTVKCFNCGERGHYKSACTKPRKQDDSQRTPGSSSSQQTSSGPPDKGKKKQNNQSLNVVDSDSGCESDAPCFLYTGVNELWMLDSGASDHFTPFESDFERRTYVSFQDSTHTGCIERFLKAENCF